MGSNDRQAAHIQWASQRLQGLLSTVRFSPILWSQDIKGRGIFYMNRLACGETALTAEELTKELKDIESKTGRTKQQVTIDLDLMLYDSTRYHLNDWNRDYFIKLMDKVKDIDY